MFCKDIQESENIMNLRFRHGICDREMFSEGDVLHTFGLSPRCLDDSNIRTVAYWWLDKVLIFIAFLQCVFHKGHQDHDITLEYANGDASHEVTMDLSISIFVGWSSFYYQTCLALTEMCHNSYMTCTCTYNCM